MGFTKVRPMFFSGLCMVSPEMINLDGLRSLYAQTAPLYEEEIVPVFAPLADDLARWIVDCAAARLNYSLYDAFDVESVTAAPSRLRALHAIDIGTGTGQYQSHGARVGETALL